jgi:FK506-binding nuclear protein
MRTLLVIALFATACAGAAVPEIDNTVFADTLGVDLADSTLLSNGEYVRDLQIGSGPPVQPGQTLSMFYSMSLVDGTLLNANFGGDAFKFVFGTGAVIAGVDQGIGGMNVGGSRQLVIPPALAFGDGLVSVPAQSIIVFTAQIAAAQ